LCSLNITDPNSTGSSPFSVIWDNIHPALIIDESTAIVTNPKSEVRISGRVIFNASSKSILINGGAVLARNFNCSKASFASVDQLKISEECLVSNVNGNAIFAKFLNYTLFLDSMLNPCPILNGWAHLDDKYIFGKRLTRAFE
jgi:hypothetical protein